MLGCGQLDTDGDRIADCVDTCLDGDWVVGSKELGMLREAWSETDSPADLNGDGTVDLFDLFDLFEAAILLGTWGASL